MPKYFSYFLVFLIIFLLWSTVTFFKLVNAYLLPSPIKVFSAFVQLIMSGELWLHIGVSIIRVIVGFIIAFVVAGFSIGFFYFFPQLDPFVRPFMHFMQHLPPLALLSLLILWLGIGESPKIAMIFLASFFPIFINTFNAIRYCDPKLLEIGQVANFSQMQIFSKIIFPSIIPSIFTGMKLGLTYAWRALIGAEFLATSYGLGYMILDARELSRSDIVILGIILFGVVGLGIDALFSLVLSKYKGY